MSTSYLGFKTESPVNNNFLTIITDCSVSDAHDVMTTPTPKTNVYKGLWTNKRFAIMDYDRELAYKDHLGKWYIKDTIGTLNAFQSLLKDREDEIESLYFNIPVYKTVKRKRVMQ